MEHWKGEGAAKSAAREGYLRALQVQREVDEFEQRFPRLASREELMPRMTWAELERQLENLAVTPVLKDMVPDLVAATRKLSPYKPSELVLREILCIASTVMDESFLQNGGEGATY